MNDYELEDDEDIISLSEIWCNFDSQEKVREIEMLMSTYFSVINV